MGCWQRGVSLVTWGWQCPDDWAEQDPRGKEWEGMPPILRVTLNWRSPSPILSLCPHLCTLGCGACPGSYTAPKGTQGDTGRIPPTLLCSTHWICGVGMPVAWQ